MVRPGVIVTCRFLVPRRIAVQKLTDLLVASSDPSSKRNTMKFKCLWVLLHVYFRTYESSPLWDLWLEWASATLLPPFALLPSLEFVAHLRRTLTIYTYTNRFRIKEARERRNRYFKCCDWPKIFSTSYYTVVFVHAYKSRALDCRLQKQVYSELSTICFSDQRNPENEKSPKSCLCMCKS